MTLKFFGFVLCLTSCLWAQSQTNENSVDIVPYWKKDESHSVKIKSTTIDLDADDGETQSYLSIFDARFKVLEVSDAGFRIEWTITNSKLADKEPGVESQILAKLSNVKMIIKLSDVGRFVELINVSDLKSAADKAIDELILNSASDPTMNAQYKAAKQLISSKQGLEIALLKPIKFYNFSFGSSYTLNQVHTNNLKYPNPMGGQPFDAVEKITLTKLDKANSTCVIESTRTIEGNAVKTAVKNYITKTSNIDPKELEEKIGKAKMEISENIMQQLDFSKGVVQKSSFKRTIYLGFQNRTTILEIETIN